MHNPSGSNVAGATPLNFAGPEFAANPFPLFAQMRAMGAVVPVPFPLASEQGPQNVWMVTRMEEALQVLKDATRFTSDPAKVNAGALFGQSKGQDAAGPNVMGGSMMTVGDPDHRRLRGLISKAFTPNYIQNLRPHIQQIANGLLDRVHDRGHMDLVHDFAYPLPITVISDMLGVLPQDEKRIQQWSSLLSGNTNMLGTDGDPMGQLREFFAYVGQLIAAKRQRPQDDLISQLIQIEDEGDRLSEPEMIAMVGLLIVAGHETTSNFIGIATWTLLTHPELLERLQADLSLVPAMVEELLRVNGSVLTPVSRFATEDVELAGQQIQKGDLILVSLGSANHDETQFTNPDDVDLARNLHRHIAFGHGMHACLGAPLARLEGDIALTTLLTRFPNLRLSVPPASITWRGNFTLRGLEHLPVALLNCQE